MNNITDEDYKKVAGDYITNPDDPSAVDHFFEVAYPKMSTIEREVICLKLLKAKMNEPQSLIKFVNLQLIAFAHKTFHYD
jgi:hypothetical protein